MKKKHTYREFLAALEGAPQKLTDNIITQAIDQGDLTVEQIKKLIDTAYPCCEAC